MERRVILAAALLVGCLGGEGAAGSGRVLLSDGTAAGDLVAAQMRNTDLTCGCIDDPTIDQWCFELVWPAGLATCMRDSIQAHESDNVESVRCYIAAYETHNACLRASGCDAERDDVCMDQFIAAEDACPKITEAASADLRACFNNTESWPTDE